MMELRGDRGQLLIIERSSLGEPGTPSGPDMLLNVTVKVGGYSAADQAWIESGDWRTFLAEVRELESRRQGRATLKGADPRDLRLVFAATDPAGHMTVSGFIGQEASDGLACRLEFSFPFDAGLLSVFVLDLQKFGQ